MLYFFLCNSFSSILILQIRKLSHMGCLYARQFHKWKLFFLFVISLVSHFPKYKHISLCYLTRHKFIIFHLHRRRSKLGYFFFKSDLAVLSYTSCTPGFCTQGSFLAGLGVHKWCWGIKSVWDMCKANKCLTCCTFSWAFVFFFLKISFFPPVSPQDKNYMLLNPRLLNSGQNFFLNCTTFRSLLKNLNYSDIMKDLESW